MAEVMLQEVDKVYPNGFHAVKDLSLEIEDGEFLVLVGPSGCGKTTALRMVAGLETITDGERLDRRPRRQRHDAEGPRHRDGVPELRALPAPLGGGQHRLRAAAAQDAEARGRGARRRGRRRMLDLTPYLDRKPKQLSGGQRQRVAMGRAIVREPKVFLMDEPLSNLDAKLRVQMRGEIAKLQHDLGDDDDLRHARPGRGDDDGAPRRRDVPRRAPADRRAAAALRRARQPVRRRLHRHAADEHPRRGRRGSPTGRSRSRSAARSSRSRTATLERYRGLASYNGRSVAMGIRSEDLHPVARAARASPRSRRASSSSRRSAPRRSRSSASTRARSRAAPGRRATPSRRSSRRRGSPPPGRTSSPRSLPAWRCGSVTTSRSRSTSSTPTSSTRTREPRSVEAEDGRPPGGAPSWLVMGAALCAAVAAGAAVGVAGADAAPPAGAALQALAAPPTRECRSRRSGSTS